MMLPREIRKAFIMALVFITVFLLGSVAAVISRPADDYVICPYGLTEDSCSPSFEGRGKWVLKRG